MARRATSLLLAFLTWASWSRAQDLDHGRVGHARPITLAEALDAARARSPELLSARAEQAASAGVTSAAASVVQHPLRLEVAGGPRFQPGGQRDVDLSVGLWQDLSLAGLGGARRRYAEGLAASARANLAVSEVESSAQAALAWIDLRFAQELEHIRERALEVARELAKVAQARVTAGRSEPTEATLAQAIVGGAEAAILDAEGLRVNAEAALAYCMGMDPSERLEAAGALDVSAFDATPKMTEEATPALSAARTRAAFEQRSAELTRTSGGAFVSLGPSVTREGTGDYIVELRVAVPLPTVNPLALESAVLEGAASRARAEVERTRAFIRLRYRTLDHEREHARHTRDTLRAGAVEPAREVVRLQLLRYRAGSTDLNALLLAQRELSNAEERWAAAAAEVRRADVRIMQLFGKFSTSETAR